MSDGDADVGVRNRQRKLHAVPYFVRKDDLALFYERSDLRLQFGIAVNELASDALLQHDRLDELS